MAIVVNSTQTRINQTIGEQKFDKQIGSVFVNSNNINQTTIQNDPIITENGTTLELEDTTVVVPGVLPFSYAFEVNYEPETEQDTKLPLIENSNIVNYNNEIKNNCNIWFTSNCLFENFIVLTTNKEYSINTTNSYSEINLANNLTFHQALINEDINGNFVGVRSSRIGKSLTASKGVNFEIPGNHCAPATSPYKFSVFAYCGDSAPTTVSNMYTVCQNSKFNAWMYQGIVTPASTDNPIPTLWGWFTGGAILANYENYNLFQENKSTYIVFYLSYNTSENIKTLQEIIDVPEDINNVINEIPLDNEEEFITNENVDVDEGYENLSDNSFVEIKDSIDFEYEETTDTPEETLTYWSEYLNNKVQQTEHNLDYYTQKDTFKTFDVCTYSIDNNYLRKLRNDIETSYENVMKFNRDSIATINCFSQYAVDKKDGEIIFDNAYENKLNIISVLGEKNDCLTYSAEPLIVYYDSMQITNSSLHFKSSPNINVDCDGRLHFFDEKGGFVTAYLTCNPKINKTIYVKPEKIYKYINEYSIDLNNEINKDKTFKNKLIDVPMTMSYELSKKCFRGLDETRYVMKASDYSSFTGSIVLNFSQQVKDKDNKYIETINLNDDKYVCRMYIDEGFVPNALPSTFIPCHSNFSEEIYGLNNASEHPFANMLVYPKMTIIDDKRIRVEFVLNSITALVANSINYTLVIYKNYIADKNIFYQFKTTFKCNEEKITTNSTGPIYCDDILCSEFTKNAINSDRLIRLSIKDDNLWLCGLDVENAISNISKVLPKTKMHLTNRKEAALLTLGNGSFKLNYTVYNVRTGFFENYSCPFNVKLRPITDAVNIQVANEIKLDRTSNAYPISIHAQYNYFTERENNFVPENLIDKIFIRYIYINDYINNSADNFCKVYVKTKNSINNSVIPLRIYTLEYNDDVFYINSKMTIKINADNSISYSFDSKNIELTNKKYNTQSLYSIISENFVLPSIKLALSLSVEPKQIIKSQTSLNVLPINISEMTRGFELTDTHKKAIQSIRTESIKQFNKQKITQISLDKFVENNIKDYLKVNNLYNSSANIQPISKLTDVDSIKKDEMTNSLLSTNLKEKNSFTTLNFADIKEFSKLWNVQPIINISNPAINYDVEENFVESKNGFKFNINEKNYLLKLKKSNKFDTDSQSIHIDVILSNVDEIHIDMSLIQQDIIIDAEKTNTLLVDSESIFVSGILDGNKIKTKATNNCELNLQTGKLNISSLEKNSISLVLYNEKTNKRISLTFPISVVNIVTDDLIFNVNDDYQPYYPVKNNESNLSMGSSPKYAINDVYYDELYKSLLNKYDNIDNKGNVVNINCVYKDVFIKFPLNDKNKNFIDEIIILIKPNTNVSINKPCRLLEINKLPTYQQNIDLDGKILLCDIEIKNLTSHIEIAVIKRYIYNEPKTINVQSIICEPLKHPVELNKLQFSDKEMNNYFKSNINDGKINFNNVLHISSLDKYNIAFNILQLFKSYATNYKDYKHGRMYYLFTNSVRFNEKYLMFANGNYPNSNTNFKFIYASKISDIFINIGIIVKNNIIIVQRNIPVTGSFEFCYHEYFKKYGFITHLVVLDKNNNIIDVFGLNVSFEDLSCSNKLLNRIQNTPIFFFDDAISNLSSDGDYDNLLPNFSFYRDSFDGNLVKEKLGYLSVLKDISDENNGKFITNNTLGIHKNKIPIVFKRKNIEDIKNIENNENNENDDFVNISSKFYSSAISFDNARKAKEILQEFTPINFHKITIANVKKETKNGETTIIDTVNKEITPLSAQYIGYVMYFMNMALLRKLGWKVENDSEDIVYYLILLDKFYNYDKFIDFYENIVNTDFDSMRNVLLFNDENINTSSLSNIEFFNKNYTHIIKFWEDRITAYQLIEDVLMEYDDSLDTAQLIDKYIDKIEHLSKTKNKREKAYAILTQNIITSKDEKKWAVNQIDERIWDVNAFHDIWKPMFALLFDDLIDISSINDAILRDIYNYGFYPTINVPEKDVDKTFIPYRMTFDGVFEEMPIDTSDTTINKHQWNSSINKCYKYNIINGNEITNIVRTFFLKTPLEKTWKFTYDVNTSLKDKNGLTFTDYKVIDDNGKDTTEWGYLTTSNDLDAARYVLTINGKIKHANKQNRNIKHKISISDKLVSASLDDVVLNWKPYVYYQYVQITPNNLENDKTYYRINEFGEYESFVKTNEFIIDIKQMNGNDVFNDWKPNFYYKDNTFLEFKNDIINNETYKYANERYYKLQNVDNPVSLTTIYKQISPKLVDNLETTFKYSNGEYVNINSSDSLYFEINPYNIQYDWKENYYWKEITEDGKSDELVKTLQEIDLSKKYYYSNERLYKVDKEPTLNQISINYISDLLFNGINLSDNKFYVVNSFDNKFKLVHDKSKIQDYSIVDEDFVINNYKENTFYYYEPVSSYAQITWTLLDFIPKPEKMSNGFRRIYATKNTFYYNKFDYVKPKSITISRLLGTTSFIDVESKEDFSNYWINEDGTNLIKMNKKSLLEAIRIQKLINKLFISELNKSVYMLDVIFKYKDMNDIVTNLYDSWHNFGYNNGIGTSNSEEYYNTYMLLDFKLNNFTPIYNCFYQGDTSFNGVISYSYIYYDKNKHEIIEKTTSANNEPLTIFHEIPVKQSYFVSSIITNSDIIHTSKLDIGVYVPKYTSTAQYNEVTRYNIINNYNGNNDNEIKYDTQTARIKFDKISSDGTYIPFVNIQPKDSRIKPFGIYPWNINKSVIFDNNSYTYITNTAPWSYAIEDLSGLQNFVDYENISKYYEIDGDGYSNTSVVIQRMENQDLCDMPAISMTYNYYPEELFGIKNEDSDKIGKYLSYEFTYTRTTDNNGTTIESSEPKIKYVSQFDLYKYPRLELTYHNIDKITDKNEATFFKITDTYTYSYIASNFTTYSLSYSFSSYSEYDLIINYNKLTNSLKSYIYGRSEIEEGKGNGILTTHIKDDFILNRTKDITVNYSFDGKLHLDNILKSHSSTTPLQTHNIESELTSYLTSYSIIYTKATNNTKEPKEETFKYSINDNNEFNYTYTQSYINSLMPLTYTLKYHYKNTSGNNIVAYKFNSNKITWDSETKKIRKIMQEKELHFFLGSVSQWQLVQDNVREINSVLDYIYNEYCSINNKLTYDYFYDGRVDRDRPDAKIFWTSSEIDTNNAWIMFFDKQMLKNNEKMAAAYIRPFIKVKNKITLTKSSSEGTTTSTSIPTP